MISQTHSHDPQGVISELQEVMPPDVNIEIRGRAAREV